METHDSGAGTADGVDAGVNVGTPGRIASVLAGGALAAYGVKRKDLPGAAIALGGAALIRRGVTGHCPLLEKSDAGDGAASDRAGASIG